MTARRTRPPVHVFHRHMSNQECRRRYFRLRYPPADQPALRFAGRTYMVTELSEGGLRFATAGNTLRASEEVYGQIRFHDNSVELISGVIQRVVRGEAIVVLTQCVTLQRAMAEQRHLSTKYPGYRGDLA